MRTAKKIGYQRCGIECYDYTYCQMFVITLWRLQVRVYWWMK